MVLRSCDEFGRRDGTSDPRFGPGQCLERLAAITPAGGPSPGFSALIIARRDALQLPAGDRHPPGEVRMAVREKLGRRERFGLAVADRALPSYQNWHAKGEGGEVPRGNPDMRFSVWPP
jgi:hypothetical protein